MSETKQADICKNYFKNGKTTTSKDAFTQIWLKLISQPQTVQEETDK